MHPCLINFVFVDLAKIKWCLSPLISKSILQQILQSRTISEFAPHDGFPNSPWFKNLKKTYQDIQGQRLCTLK